MQSSSCVCLPANPLPVPAERTSSTFWSNLCPAPVTAYFIDVPPSLLNLPLFASYIIGMWFPVYGKEFMADIETTLLIKLNFTVLSLFSS